MYSALHSAVRFGGFELDAGAGELRKGKKRLHLPPQPLKVSSAAQVNWSPETNYDSSFGTRTLLSILSKDSMCVFGRFEKC